MATFWNSGSGANMRREMSSSFRYSTSPSPRKNLPSKRPAATLDAVRQVASRAEATSHVGR